VAPEFQRAAATGGPSFMSLSKVIGVLTPINGGRAYTIESPFVRDTAVLTFNVTFPGVSQRYVLSLAATDTVGDTLFKSTREVVANPGYNVPLHDVLQYIAPDTAVRFLTVALSDTALVGGDSLVLAAIGYDGAERRITPLYIGWTSRDTMLAKVSSRGPSSAKAFGGAIENDVWIVGRAFNGVADSVLVPVRLRIGSVVLNADTLRMTTGWLATVSADVLSLAGASLDRPVVWTALDTTVATAFGFIGGGARGARTGGAATANAFGRIAAIRPGTTKIIASSGAKADTATVVVTLPPVASVVITPDTLPILVGQQARFAAELRDALNNVLTGRAITWQSSDPLVASVGADGTVTGVGVGLATVSATSEGIVGSATSRVDGAALTIVRTTISPKIAQLVSLGDAVQLIAQSYAADSSRVAGSYAYSVSGGQTVVSVDGFGRVTALAVGSAYVIANEIGGTSDSAAVTVTQIAKRVQISAPATLDAIGFAVTYHAAVFDAGGSPIPAATLVWSVDNPAVAVIDVTGGDSVVVRAVGNGKAQIAAASDNTSGASELFVNQVAKALAISPKSLVLGIEGRARLVPSLFDGNGYRMMFSPAEVKWAVAGAAGVIEVDSVGEVHAKASGASGVYATAQGVRSATVSVDVSDAAPRTISFSADTLLLGPNGSRISLYLSSAPAAPVTVSLSDPLGLVKFEKDTLIFDQGRTSRDVTLSALVDGKTSVIASDAGKVYAPDTLSLTVGTKVLPAARARVVSPPVLRGRITSRRSAIGTRAPRESPSGALRTAPRSPADPVGRPGATP
jgi:uncharacterized protein YjdB